MLQTFSSNVCFSSRLLMLHDIITKVKLNKMYLKFDGFGKSFLQMLSFMIFIKAAKSCTWIFTQSLAEHSENHK